MPSAQSIVYLVLVVCMALALGFSQKPTAGPNSRPSKPEDQVAQVERDWLAADAKGDAASLRRIISDDFIGSSFDGKLLGKEDIIPEDSGPGGFAGATPGETNVRVFGDTGVLFGTIKTGSGPQAREIRVTLVCQKKAQDWQIIAAQMTKAN
ncbi:MAG TPA: nuclear transport factor 2 family protein [Candidatus Angelobacter sp.]